MITFRKPFRGSMSYAATVVSLQQWRVDCSCGSDFWAIQYRGECIPYWITADDTRSIQPQPDGFLGSAIDNGLTVVDVQQPIRCHVIIHNPLHLNGREMDGLITQSERAPVSEHEMAGA